MKIRMMASCALLMVQTGVLAEVVPVAGDLIIHLKADALTLNDNDPVTAWPDSATGDSTDGSVASISGFGTPTYVADALHGKPAVRFVRPADVGSAPDSALQALASGTWSWDKSKGVSVFMVCTGGADDTEQRAVSIGKSGGEVYKCFHCDVSAGQSGVRYNNGYCIADSPFAHGEWHVGFRQIAQGGGYGSVRYDVNGTPFVATTSNALGKDIAFDDAGNDITLGAGAQNGALINWYDGDIAEVLVYNKQLTPAEIRKVNTYLNNKYGVYDDDTGENFMVVAIPDSQGYVENPNQPASNNLNIEEMAWIAGKVKSKNIVFVSHEGDFMTTSNPTHYDRADTALQELLNRVPLGVVPGNHDYDDTNPSQGATLWNAYFGYDTDYFRDKSWYGGAFLNSADSSGMTSFQTFSTASIDFLHIALECDARDAVLDWAQGIIDAYPGWPTIVTTHSYLSASDGSYKAATSRDPLPRNNGQQVWDEFIKVNPQIFMVLCGHSFTPGPSQRRTDNNTAGYPVHQLLADYQDISSGPNLGNGGGWIRLMDFSPLSNTIRVRTYSTSLNKYSTHASLMDGSSYARNYGEFNYANAGAGSLITESDSRASEFSLPFIYGSQLPRPAEVYGDHMAGLVKSFVLDASADWTGSGLAFDPSHQPNGEYDRMYYVNRVSDSNAQGLYSASISGSSASGRLRLGSYENPSGCTVDANGDAYVCYSVSPAVRKVLDPSGTPSNMDMVGNYRGAGDDDIQSVMMVPTGFGGGFEAGTDLILVDTGLDNDAADAIVVLDASSTASSPVYTVVWEDTADYFSANIKGCASAVDGYCYLTENTIPEADLGGITRPYISRVNASGVMQRIFLNVDVTRDGAAPFCDDSIAANPVDGSIWLATAADSANGELYPRTVWRIDAANAAAQGGHDYLATVTPEILNAYLNIGVNGLSWSPDGKRLGMICPDTHKVYVYGATD